MLPFGGIDGAADLPLRTYRSVRTSKLHVASSRSRNDQPYRLPELDLVPKLACQGLAPARMYIPRLIGMNQGPLSAMPSLQLSDQKEAELRRN